MTNMQLLYIALGFLTLLAVVFLGVLVHYRRRYNAVLEELEQKEIDELNTHHFGSVRIVDGNERKG